MPKIEISPDQNSISVHDIEHEFIEYTKENHGFCGLKHISCSLNYLCSGQNNTFQPPCVPVFRKDKRMGCFQLKQK